MEVGYPKRLFAALEMEESVRSALGAYAGNLKPIFSVLSPRWVDPSLYHLTLHFYGECGDARTGRIRQGLGSCRRLSVPPRIVFTDLGFLPSERRPRVLYLGVSIDPRDALEPVVRATRLLDGDGAGGLDAGAVSTGHGPWKAHLTLARLGCQKPFPVSEKALLPSPPALFFFPKDFALLESILSSRGPVYRALERYPLI